MEIPAAQREESDVTGLFITLTFTGMVSAIGLLALLCWWIFPRAPHTEWVPYPVPRYPAPELEASPHQDFVRFYRSELNRLNSIGWIDRAKGIAHIPIEQAMQEVARKGIPDWPSPGAQAQGAQAQGPQPQGAQPQGPQPPAASQDQAPGRPAGGGK